MLVEIRNLRIQFPTATGLSEAVRNVSLTLGQEKLGIVGESGSGKSLTARSILRLLPANAVLTADKLSFDDIDILSADENALRRIRGARSSPTRTTRPLWKARWSRASTRARTDGTPPRLRSRTCS